MPCAEMGVTGACPHRARDEPVGQLSEQDAADGRRLLEASRRVDRVSGRERLTTRGITRDDLAGVHADPHRQFHPELHTEDCAQLGDAGSQVERPPNRPEGIVFVGRREAEHAHHRVSDVLLHLPAVRPQCARRNLEVARLDIPQHLWIETLPERRRADEVAEDDRDQRAPRARVRLAERESALGAEACVVRPEVAAGRAGPQPRHRSLDRTPQAARIVQPSPSGATAHASWLATTPGRIPVGGGASTGRGRRDRTG